MISMCPLNSITSFGHSWVIKKLSITFSLLWTKACFNTWTQSVFVTIILPHISLILVISLFSNLSYTVNWTWICFVFLKRYKLVTILITFVLLVAPFVTLIESCTCYKLTVRTRVEMKGTGSEGLAIANQISHIDCRFAYIFIELQFQ